MYKKLHIIYLFIYKESSISRENLGSPFGWGSESKIIYVERSYWVWKLDVDSKIRGGDSIFSPKETRYVSR